MTRREFHAIESIQEFDDLVRGALVRYRWLEDQVGWLRRDILIAQGVTLSDAPGPPKPGTPTFEALVGRPPVSLADPFRDLAEPRSELEEAEAADRIARASLALAQAQHESRGPRA
jgi:hypothetical protein